MVVSVEGRVTVAPLRFDDIGTVFSNAYSPMLWMLLPKVRDANDLPLKI